MIIGVVATKKLSRRFPNKNMYLFEGAPLFWHSVQPLLDSERVDKIYVTTDSHKIKTYCETRGIPIIWRYANATRPDDKLITIIRYIYYSILEEPDIVVSIMPNCPGHKGEDVDKAIKVLEDNKLKEVRSFDSGGDENGILVLKKDVMETNNDISYYMGCIINNARDIHYKKELYE